MRTDLGTDGVNRRGTARWGTRVAPIALVAVIMLGSLVPELAASLCIYAEKENVSCTTGDCQCVYETPKGETNCNGFSPSWIRGDLGDARSRCRGTGNAFRDNLINGGCGKMWAQYTNCVWLMYTSECACPQRNEVLDVPVMFNPTNQQLRAKTECIECD